MISELTVVTTTRNTLHSLSLMWESLCKYHKKPKWICVDDASWDGATDYCQKNADVFIENKQQVNFGQNIDRAINLVKTKYTLIVDSDVEFLGPIIEEMIDLFPENAFCVGDQHCTGKCEFASYPLNGQEKIDHSLVLFDTKKLQNIVKHFSFESYISIPKKEYYDGGSMILKAANLLDYKIIKTKIMWQKAIHYGGISALFVPGIDPGALLNYQKRYEIIKKRLSFLRSGIFNTDGLIWNGSNWSCHF